MTTTTYTPSISVTYNLNGRDVTTLPVDLVETKTGAITTDAFGTVTNNIASYKAQNSVSSATGGFVNVGSGAQIREFFGGTAGYYSGFSVVPATASTSLLVKQGELQCAITESTLSSGPNALGTHTLDVTPYAVAMVTRVASTDPSSGLQRFDGIPGVKVTVTVEKSGGGADYPILNGALTGTTERYLLTSSNTSFQVVLPEYSTLDASSSLQLSIRGPVGTGWSPTARTTPGTVDRLGCPTPSVPYDPYFGRTPTADKDVLSLRCKLEFPSGVVWQTTVPCSTLFGPSSVTGYQLGTKGEGNGLLHITDGATGVQVSLVGTINTLIAAIPAAGKYTFQGGTDLDLSAATGQAAFADSGAVSYTGQNTGSQFNFVEDLTGSGTALRQSAISPIPGACFVFVLDASFDYTTPPPSGPIGACNVGQDQGSYHRAYSDGGAILYSRADRAAPYGGFDLTNVTLAAAGSEPRLTVLPSGAIRCVFNSSGAVVYSDSDDDGQTWSSPVTILPGCTHPQVATGPDGTTLYFGYSGGNLKACMQGIGDPSPSTPVTVKSDTGAALSVADDSFGLTYTYSGQGGWVLHVLISGETDTSEWICFSEDELAFKRVV